MTPRVKYWILQIAAFLIAVIPPVWAVCEKLPIWKARYGTAQTFGFGLVILLVVLLVVFRKTLLLLVKGWIDVLVDRIKEKTGIVHIPPMLSLVLTWASALLVVIALIPVVSGLYVILVDLKGIFMAGLVGAGLGWLLSLIGIWLGIDRGRTEDIDGKTE